MARHILLGDLELELEESRQASYDSKIPQEPVEKGTNISDDITNKPVSYSFTVVIAPDSTGDPDTLHREIRAKLNRLITLRDNKEVFRLVTPENVFENAAIQKLQYTKSAELAYRVSLTVTEIRTTEEEEAQAETGERDAGKRPTDDVSENQTRKQLAREDQSLIFPQLSLGNRQTYQKQGEEDA